MIYYRRHNQSQQRQRQQQKSRSSNSTSSLMMTTFSSSTTTCVVVMMMSIMIASLFQHQHIIYIQPVSSLVFEFTGDEKEMGFSLEDWEIHEFGDHEDDGNGHGDDDEEDDEEIWNDDKEVWNDDDDEEVWNDDDDEVWDDNEKHNNEKCRSICTYNNKSSSIHDSIIGGGGGVTALMHCVVLFPIRYDSFRFLPFSFPSDIHLTRTTFYILLHSTVHYSTT